MVELLKYKGYEFDKEALKLAFSYYEEFKKSEEYDEEHKWENLTTLNNWIEENSINEKNINEFAELLKNQNLNTGPFVNYRPLNDFIELAESNSEKAVNLIRELFNNEEKLSERIDNIHEELGLQSPFYAYLLAASDIEIFPTFKVSSFYEFLDIFVTNDHNDWDNGSLGEKYEFYQEFCNVLADFMSNQSGKKTEAIDAQDFIYCITNSEYGIKYEFFLEYLQKYAEKLSDFQNDEEKFIEELEELPVSFLEERYSYYDDEDKDGSVQTARKRVLEGILQKKNVNLSQIMRSINEKSEKNVFKQWNRFKILAQIYLDYNKGWIDKYVDEIVEKIKDNLEYSEKLDEKKRKFIVQGYPQTKAWVLFYPENNNFRNSFQLGLQINPQGIEYGLNNGDKVDDGFTDLDFNPIEDVSLDKIIEKYNEFESYLFNQDSPVDNSETKKGWREKISNADNLWVIRAGKGAELFYDYLNNEVISIGYGIKENYLQEGLERINKAVEENNVASNTKSQYKLFFEMGEGDIVLVYHHYSILAIGEIVDKSPFFNDSLIKKSDHNYLRKVKWLKELDDGSFSSSSLLAKSKDRSPSYVNKKIDGSSGTIFKYTDSEYVEELKRIVLNEETNLDEILGKLFVNEEDEKEFRSYFFKVLYSLEELAGSERVSVTYRSNENMISLNYGSWKIISVQRKNGDYFGKIAIDRSNLPRNHKEWQEYLGVSNDFSDEEGYILLDVKWDKNLLEEHPELMKGWKKAIDRAKEKFQNSKRSRYRRNHREDLFRWITEHERQVTWDLSSLFVDLELFYPKDVEERLKRQLESALKNGKHVILNGAPGTGKSKLAKEVFEEVKTRYEMVTASSDWSTFDTIGGYQPDNDGQLDFEPGIFLECLENEERGRRKMLLIDEINRADIDKAFGSFFSVLAGDKVTLSFQDRKSGENIQILPDGEKSGSNIYSVPDDWRIIATMNNLDKASLYEMSFAFMRRFAFITVPTPSKKQIEEGIIDNYSDAWKLKTENSELLSKVWQKVMDKREIGPAIIKDMAEYLETSENGIISDAIVMYVFPQLHGVKTNDITELVNSLENIEGVEDNLAETASDFFQIPLPKFQGNDES